jgi:capsular exopolysaccharide synthesis family protein
MFYKYIRFLPLFIVSIAVALLGAFIYLRYSTSIYASSGTLLIKEENKSSQSNDRIEDILSGGNHIQNLQNEIEILKSKPLMTRVVKKLDLEFDYALEGRVKDLNLYNSSPFRVELIDTVTSLAPFSLKLMFGKNGEFAINEQPESYRFNEEISYKGARIKVVQKSEVQPGLVYEVKWRSAERAAGALVKDLKVMSKIAGTGIVQIGMEASSPQLTTDIVNTLMNEYGVMTVEQNNYSADTMIAFIDDRLDKLKPEIDSIQLIELNFRQKENLFNVDIQSENYLTNLTDVNKAISEQELRISTVNNVDAYIRNKQNQFTRVVPSSLGLEDITLNELVMSYNKAQLERQILLNSNIPAQNPAVKEAEEVIEKQRQNLAENLANMRSAYVNTIGQLRGQINVQQGGLKEMPTKVKQLVEIQRQIATKLALYNLLEGKREETAISRASTISSSTIIEKAEVPVSPAKPNKRMIQAIAAAIGFIIPALIVFLIEVLNDKVSTRMDVEKLTQAPIVGEVGHSYSDKVLVVDRTSRGMVAEQFRIIRSNLQYVLNHVDRPVILVTSSFSGEGKSFASTNMAAVMALTGKKTVLLEFDIRKPKVLSGLNMQKGAGISNYLLGKAELKDLIVPAPDYENFFILPCGPIPPNPSEILLDTKISEMFVWLKANFDVVIIDTAPVGMVSDAMTLGKFADCTLYLVRQGRTFRKQLIMIDEMYKEKKLPKISIIINDVKLKAGYGYYGYGRYGYGYGYGENGGYYENEKPNTSFLRQFLSKLNPVNWFRK